MGMTITLKIPDRTVAAVITLLTKDRTQHTMTMTTQMLGSDMVKDGAEFNLLPDEQRKAGMWE